MSWRTSALVLVARNVGRALGLNSWIAARWRSKGYEVAYDKHFFAALQPGDCVWDVGANVGYYTRQFAQSVGDHGQVFAFEPSPANFARLAEACRGITHVKLIQIGLGRENGKLSFQQGRDELGATSRVISGSSGDQVVEIRSGTSLIECGHAVPPNVIKVDVEGFEFEVLEGLADSLDAPTLRAVGVEVHFGILKERGMSEAPRQIEVLLRRHGFDVKWPDSSHLLATRAAP